MSIDLQEEIRTIRFVLFFDHAFNSHPNVSHLQHPNVIKFIGCEQGPDYFRLVMEAVPGGSLTDLLNKFGNLVDRPESIVEYSTQVKTVFFNLISAWINWLVLNRF